MGSAAGDRIIPPCADRGALMVEPSGGGVDPTSVPGMATDDRVMEPEMKLLMTGLNWLAM